MTCIFQLVSQEYIEDIYLFFVNIKYISSNVLKISVISQVHSTSETADNFQHTRSNSFGIYRKKK